MNIREAGTLDVTITQFKYEGIDNDIHLLSSLDRDDLGMAVDCFARGDNRIEVAVSRGKCYLIVDGRNNSPGEYTLTVDFRPESLPGR